MLSSSRTLDKLKVNCTIVSSYYNLEFFYFVPDDVDFDSNSIKGQVFQDNQWSETVYDFDKDVDVIYDRFRRIFRSEHKQLYDLLLKKPFTHDPIANSLNKLDVYDMFSKESSLSPHIIPYQYYNSSDQTIDFTSEYEEIILKPQIGLKGAGLYYIRKNGSHFNIIEQNHHEELTREEFDDWLNTTIKKKPFVMQKFIRTRTLEDKPFDIRVLMMKDETGDWNIIRLIPRVGLGFEKVTLMRDGGYIGYWKPFIERNFGEDKYSQINRDIQSTSKEMIRYFEKHHEEKIGEAGLDLAISKDGQIYLIELNVRSPGFQYHEFEVAKSAMGYAKTLAAK